MECYLAEISFPFLLFLGKYQKVLMLEIRVMLHIGNVED